MQSRNQFTITNDYSRAIRLPKHFAPARIHERASFLILSTITRGGVLLCLNTLVFRSVHSSQVTWRRPSGWVQSHSSTRATIHGRRKLAKCLVANVETQPLNDEVPNTSCQPGMGKHMCDQLRGLVAKGHKPQFCHPLLAKRSAVHVRF